MIEFPTIGDMRRRLTVQQKTLTSDGAGGQSVAWNVYATIWGNIEPSKGEKRVIGGKLTHVVTHTISIRFRTDLDNSMRITYDSRIFQIHGIVNIDEKRRYLLLYCQEGVGS